MSCPECGSTLILIWMGEQYGIFKWNKYTCTKCGHHFNEEEEESKCSVSS